MLVTKSITPRVRRANHWLAAMVAAVAVASTAAFSPVAADDDTIAIGFNAPLSGPASSWGLPGQSGLQMFVDQLNEEGGVQVGDTTYKLELHSFDNEFIPSKSLQGARQLVFEHDVRLILDVGSTTADAQHPFLTEQKVFYGSLVASDITPERPYVLAGADYNPRGDMMRAIYTKMLFPDKNRYAVLSQDDATGLVTQSWEVAAARVLDYELVYDKHFSQETTDFAPIVTSVLATNPDIVSLNVTWPDFVVPIVEQLYLQGFEGVLSANYFVEEQLTPKVPADWLEKVRTIDSYPLFTDPWWGSPSVQEAFADDWFALYGPGAPQDQKRAMSNNDTIYVPMLQLYLAAVEEAGTLDPDTVLQTIQSIGTVDTILGPTGIGGESMWGQDNMMTPPVPTTEFRADCECKRIQMMMQFEPWYELHKEEINAVVRERGHMWDQRR